MSVHAEPIEVLNPSFEYVGGVPVGVKTMGVEPDDWSFGNGMPTGGGIENPSSDGDVCVAVNNLDSVFQLTEHTISAGDEYILKFDSYFLWSNDIYDCTFQGRLYYDNGGSRTVIDNVEAHFSTGMPDWTWHEYTLTTTIPVGHAAIGNKLGIELATIDNGGVANSWLGFDDVRLSTPRTLPASTFYIDSITGNDDNTGLATDQAWQTLGPVNDMPFIGGDKILFKAGTTYTGQLKPQGSGADGNPIIIDMYGTGPKPRIDGEGTVNPTLYLYNVEYYEVSNLEITNTGPTVQAGRMGVYLHLSNFGTAHDIKVKKLYIHDVNGSNVKSEGGGYGIKWYIEGQSVQSRFDGLLIEDCHLVRCDRNGIIGGGSYWTRDVWYPSLNVVIRGNLLEDIGGDGIVPICCDGALVEYNTVRDGGQRIPQGDASAGIWPWSSDNTVVQFNEVSGHLGPWDAQGFDSDWNCENTLIQYNYSHDNMGGFLLVCSPGDQTLPANIGCNNTVVRYNISVNDGFQPTVISPTFHISGSVTNTQIYNNTIYIGTLDVIDIFDYSNWGSVWPDGTHVYNNIFYVAGSAGNSNWGSATNSIYNNNVWYGSISNKPPDPYALYSDPMLINPGSGGDGRDTLSGYKLQGTSPCIEAGATIADNGGRDFWCNRLDPAKDPDIGAHAYTQLPLTGDFNDDDKIDLEDLGVMSLNWLTIGCFCDLTGDAITNTSDLRILAGDWLFGTGP